MDPDELLRAAMAADKAGNTKARDELVRAAEAAMGIKAAPPATSNMADPMLPPRVPDNAVAGDLPGDPNPQPDRFGDTISKAVAGPMASLKSYGNALGDRSQSPTAAALPGWIPEIARNRLSEAGDIGGLALSGLGTAYAGAAGLAGEVLGGSPTNENKLARDLMMMGQVAVPELAGVSGPALAMRAGAKPIPLLTPKQEAARAAIDIGVTPSLGMTGKAGGMTAAALEKVPFSGGIVAKDAERAVGQISEAFARAVDSIGTAKGPVGAGDRLQEGLKSFVTAFKDRSGKLYSAVDQKIPKGTTVAIDRTAQVVEGQKASFAANPALAAKLGLNNWDNIISEAQANGMSWDALKQFRSKVGEALSSPRGSLADEDIGRLKQLYGALTEDMEVAAKAAGPEAYKAWTRANSHYKTGAKRIETYLDGTITAKSPERAFEAFSAMTKADRASSDVTRMREIKASLPESDWQTVSASIVDRLGKSTPGAQNAAGDKFSAATFLTEWNKMSPEAKNILLPYDVRTKLDEIAKVSERAKAAGAERNTSNTGTVTAAGTVGAGLATAPGTTLSVLGAANVSARALTSEMFLNMVTKAQAGNRKGLEAMALGSGPFAADARAILSVVGAGEAANSPAPTLRIAN